MNDFILKSCKNDSAKQKIFIVLSEMKAFAILKIAYIKLYRLLIAGGNCSIIQELYPYSLIPHLNWSYFIYLSE